MTDSPPEQPEQPRRPLQGDDDVLPSRHPFEIYLLVLVAAAATPAALGKAPTPGSVNDAMPRAAAIAWSAVLAIGSILALVGIAWPRPKDPTRLSVTGLLLEQVGLVATGSAAVLYGAIVPAVADHGQGLLVPTALILGYGVSCLRRAWQLQTLLRSADRVDDHDGDDEASP